MALYKNSIKNSNSNSNTNNTRRLSKLTKVLQSLARKKKKPVVLLRPTNPKKNSTTYTNMSHNVPHLNRYAPRIGGFSKKVPNMNVSNNVSHLNRYAPRINAPLTGTIRHNALPGPALPFTHHNTMRGGTLIAPGWHYDKSLNSYFRASFPKHKQTVNNKRIAAAIKADPTRYVKIKSNGWYRNQYTPSPTYFQVRP